MGPFSIQWNLRTKATFAWGRFFGPCRKVGLPWRLFYSRIGRFVPFSLAVVESLVAIWSPLVRRFYCTSTAWGQTGHPLCSKPGHLLTTHSCMALYSLSRMVPFYQASSPYQYSNWLIIWLLLSANCMLIRTFGVTNCALCCFNKTIHDSRII